MEYTVLRRRVEPGPSGAGRALEDDNGKSVETIGRCRAAGGAWPCGQQVRWRAHARCVPSTATAPTGLRGSPTDPLQAGWPMERGQRRCWPARITAAMNERPLFTVGEAAVLIGLSPHTIRSWERRYGFLTPQRSPSNQRRYSLEDVETLKRVKQIRSLRGSSLRLAVQEATGAVVEVPPSPATSSPPQPGEAASENSWRTAADLFLGPVAIVGPRGYILDCNLPFARLAGQNRDQLRGGLFSDLVDPEDRFKATQFYKRPLTRRRGWELSLRVPEGWPRTFSFEGAPARDQGRAVLVCRASPVASPVPDEALSV
jgi:PAS domain-containing protein